MFKIVGKQMHLTRGDAGSFNISAKNNDGSNYIFNVGDTIRFNVFKRKDVRSIVLLKDTLVETEGPTVTISFSSTDSTIGELIDKPDTYWYEIILNPGENEQTIIGYDMDGATELILYPEGKEENI